MSHQILLWLYLAGVVYLALFFAAWTHRPSVVSRAFAAMMFCAAIWAFSYAEELRAAGMSGKILCLQIRMAVICFIPFFWVVLTLGLTGQIRRFSGWRLGLFLIVPILTALLSLTLRHHEGFRYDFRLESIGHLSLLRFSKSPFDIIHEIHNHAVSILGFVVLVMSLNTTNTVLRKQIIGMAVSFLLPLLINLLFVFQVIETQGLNPTPFALLPASLLQAWIVIRYHILDLVPIAREMVLQHIGVGAVVLDRNQSVVDINPAAAGFLGQPSEKLIGQPDCLLPAQWMVGEDLLRQEHGTVEVEDPGTGGWFRMVHTRIVGRDDETFGHLIMIHDIQQEIRLREESEQERAREDKLRRLQVQQRLVRDIHDGLGGVITNMGITAALAEKRQDSAGKSESIAFLGSLTEQANAELRDLMNTLELESMQGSDLVDSIRRSAGALLPDSVHVEMDLSGFHPGDDMGIAEGMSLIRLIREGLNNIVRHADASRVNLLFRNDAERFLIRLADNGHGFDPDRVERGRGLDSLEARARELGGRCTLTSSPDGTQLSFDIPLPLTFKQTL